jgi:hypothetical protein
VQWRQRRLLLKIGSDPADSAKAASPTQPIQSNELLPRKLEGCCMLSCEKLRIVEGVNYQALGDNEDGVLLSMSSGYLYRCNRTALAILDSVKDGPTYAVLLTRFATHFGMAEEQAQIDLSGFVEMLLEEKLLAKVA